MDCSRLDAWPVFARHCMAHPHKHLPTVLHMQDVSQGMTWGVLRRLTPVRGALGERAQDVSRFITKCRVVLSGGVAGPQWLWPLRQMVDALGVEVDVHRDNVMYDKAAECIVLTDPFSFKEGEGSYAY